jgi:hypothetical protein
MKAVQTRCPQRSTASVERRQLRFNDPRRAAVRSSAQAPSVLEAWRWRTDGFGAGLFRWAWKSQGRERFRRPVPRCTMASMPNIASVFKDEISRVARKEVRSELLGLKKAAGAHRAKIAALKRRVQALEQALRRPSETSTSIAAVVQAEESSQALRFSAKGLASHRQRLGLSAEDCGLLVGAPLHDNDLRRPRRPTHTLSTEK